MNKLIISKGRIRLSCDECYSQRKGCDLELPKCSRCEKKGIKCTRLRKTNKKPSMYDNEKFRNQTFKLNLKKEETIIKINTRIDNSIKFQISNFLSMKVGRVNNLSSCISVFPIKLFYSPLLMDDSQIYLYKRNPHLSIELIFNRTKIDSLMSIKTIYKPIDFNNFNLLIQRAIEIYFERVNALLPLFTKKQFYSKPRGFKLIYSIALVGLSLLANKEDVDSIAKYLLDYLNISFQPSKACETLEDIQSMVVLINGLRGHKYSLPSYYFTNLKRCCFMLGLHLIPNSKLINFDTLIERKLCYSAALFLNSLDDSQYSRNFDHHNLWKNEQKMLAKLRHSKDEDGIIKYCYLVMTKFYYYAAIVVQISLEPTLYSFDLNITNAKVLNMLKWTNKLILYAFKEAIFHLEIIRNEGKVIVDVLNKAICSISIFYYSFKIAAFDMEEMVNCTSLDSIYTTNRVQEHILDDSQLENYFKKVIECNYKLGLESVSSFRYYSFFLVQRSLSSPANASKKYQCYLNILNYQLSMLTQNSLSDKASKTINMIFIISNSER